MKRLFGLIFVFVLALSLPVSVSASEETVQIDGKPVQVYSNLKLELNGSEVVSDHKPFIYKSRTYVPIRLVAEHFDSQVDWFAENKEVMIKRAEDVLVIAIDSNAASKNGTSITLDDDSIPKLVGFSDGQGKTMVPLRAVSELLGYEVNWDRQTRTASISQKSEENLTTQARQVEIPKEARSQISAITKIDHNGNQAILIEGVNGSDYETFSLKNPDRFVIDINDAKFYSGTNTSTIDIGIGTITNLRANDRLVDGKTNGQVRVVLDASHPCDIKIEKTDKGLVIIPDNQAQAPSVPEMPALSVNETDFKDIDSQVKEDIKGPKANQNPKSRSEIVVVIDPGHGGKDPGAIGIGGRREKDINFAASQRVANILRSQGYDVRLTRTSDTFISVLDRAKYANSVGAHVFLSIHCNSASNSTANGIETFYAPKNLVKIKTQNQYPFGKAIHDGLKSGSKSMADRGLKQGPRLIVLNSTQMPAALVELGFMSHPGDMNKLNNQAHIEAASQGLAGGINKYLQDTYGL